MVPDQNGGTIRVWDLTNENLSHTLLLCERVTNDHTACKGPREVTNNQQLITPIALVSETDSASGVGLFGKCHRDSGGNPFGKCQTYIKVRF